MQFSVAVLRGALLGRTFSAKMKRHGEISVIENSKDTKIKIRKHTAEERHPKNFLKCLSMTSSGVRK